MLGSFITATRVALLGLVLNLCPTLLARHQLLSVFHFQVLERFDWYPTTSHVVLDSSGFVRIGTMRGLNRYDGYSFKVYRNIPNDTNSPSSSRINSLLVDTKGRLWVGTAEKGLSLYDSAHDRSINFYPAANDSAPYEQRNVLAVLEDRSGNLWLAASPSQWRT